VTRLLDMGVEPYLVASSLTGTVAQRLVRRVCSFCAEPFAPDAPSLEVMGITPADWAGDLPFRQGRGCDKCLHTGYKGRVGLYELFVADEAIRRMTVDRAASSAMKEQAIKDQGMRTLLGDGRLAVLAGKTTPEEVMRVSGSDGSAEKQALLGVRPMAQQTFAYTALDATGARRAGAIEAESREAAVARLAGEGRFVLEIGEAAGRPAVEPGAARSGKQPSRQDLALFTRRLADLASAGLPLDRVLQVVADQSESGALKRISEEALSDVRSGMPISQALAKHPKYFNSVFTQTLRAGEASGQFGEAGRARLAASSAKWRAGWPTIRKRK